MSALMRAVQRLQQIENSTPKQIEEQKNYEWCDYHDGRKPNRCEHCFIYTYGEFCPKCLHNIGPFKDRRRRQILDSPAQLPRKSRTFIQM